MKDLENEAISEMNKAFSFAISKRVTFEDARKFKDEINKVKKHEVNSLNLEADVCYAKSYIDFYPALHY